MASPIITTALVEDFLERYPEFASGEQLVELALDEAASSVSKGRFGKRWNEAVQAKAAHILWSNAFGVSLRQDGSSGSADSVYLRRYQQIVREVIPGFEII
jgi:Protein of unknown function (DUF4054)